MVDPDREDEGEIEAPRRGASAQLQVSEPVAAEAAIRQAMDPANQSLGEALRLSYRLLQFAILGLLVTFLFSGFQTVKEGFSGVKTVFGRIVGDPGDEALAPGLTPFWPYPVGEITSFEVRRSVDLRREFWPRPNRNLTTEQAVEAADNTQPLRPGPEGDGSIITAEGDLAHVQLVAEYSVEDPVRFLQAIDLEQADRLVRVALQRGVVVAGARLTLPELVDQREQPTQLVQAEAQRVLDDMASGIRLSRVTLPERSAPFAVRNELGRVQRNREDAKTAVDKARQDATAALLAAAGPRWEDLLGLIDQYEAALSSGDLAASDALLKRLGERFESKDIAGQASLLVNRAKAYQGAVSSELGKELRRIEGLRETFEQNPRQLARQLWLETVRSVLANGQAEVFSLPPGMELSQLSIASSPDVMQARRNAEVERKRMLREMSESMMPTWNIGVRQIMINQAGRRLDAKGDKGFGRENK
jgi:regulator of protease activity HflC (stomatin/prohibitin superfamily)